MIQSLLSSGLRQLRSRAALGLLGLAVSCGGAPQGEENGQPQTAQEPAAQDSSGLFGANRGAVYTMTNDPGRNAVEVFSRGADGALTVVGDYFTGGQGTGAGLGNQGAVALSADGNWLLAVNAGSNDISVFRVMGPFLQLTDRVASGGVRPVSLTLHGNLVYVLNAGGDGNIAGFRMGLFGQLTPMSGASRPLSSAAPGPAQISFSPDGRQLVVTEKGMNCIDTFAVDYFGRPGPAQAHTSSGMTPYGFAFDPRGRLFVSEAFGGAVDGGAVSSYELSHGEMKAISPSVPTTETAACWVAVTGDGRYTYTTNAGSGSISGYRIGEDGALTLLNADGVTGQTGEGSKPLDVAISRDNRFLYVLDGGTHDISAFAVGTDGSLSPIDRVEGMPTAANGLAVR